CGVLAGLGRLARGERSTHRRHRLMAAATRGKEGSAPSRRDVLVTQGHALIEAIQSGDEASVESAVLALSRSRRIFAPLVFAVGAFVMLFQGLQLVFVNWRLTLVQVLPAMWIWAAMLDLKAHTINGKDFHNWLGPTALALVVLIALVTAASFFLNAVFAFAVAKPGRPEVRPGVLEARRHRTPILVSGAILGGLLAFATMIVTRWGRPWFGIVLSIVVGLMMLCYVAVPARLIGGKPKQSRRDKLTTSAVGGAIGATVCTPPYLLGRIGILMLGSKVLFIPGIFVFAVGITLQAGATGAVRAIKMSVSLTAGRHSESAPPKAHVTQ
ncbi:MAG: hypothetical protein ACRDPA_07885, partial [Solirubrobacteraceae bacterium]